ncbi:hypothetical protein HK098_005149 [Nowakowskiella sp. JEL0407]|nr:hypothetical protein HK098_005149 [Nowakowskiella sp. JEL0407]
MEIIFITQPYLQRRTNDLNELNAENSKIEKENLAIEDTVKSLGALKKVLDPLGGILEVLERTKLSKRKPEKEGGEMSNKQTQTKSKSPTPQEDGIFVDFEEEVSIVFVYLPFS